MSTQRRRHSPAVYRRRRIVVFGGLLLVILLIVLAIWQPWNARGAATPGTSPTASAPAAAQPGASTPSPSSDGSASACTQDQLEVDAMTDKASYAAGEKPQLSAVVKNISAKDCTLNVGTSQQLFEIKSGDDVWWKSTDCQSNASDQAVTIKAGSKLESGGALEWGRDRSSAETCDSQDRPAAPGGGATYRLVVTIDGFSSAKPAEFVLN